jgi:hypothetical protein
MAIVAIILEFVVALVPDLQMDRFALGALVASIVAMAMGTHTLTDITAIKSEADKS